MSEIKFRRDTSFRKGLFTPDSFAHPAKMDAQLLIWIVERYTKVGETILDPMFGSGTMVLACTIGRNVIGVELEQKFVDMAKANWEKVRMMPQLGYEMGECQIIQGDARQLEYILVDHAIFSPPYAEAKSGGGIAQEGYAKDYQRGKIRGDNFDPVGKRSYMPENIGARAENISRLPYGSISSVITSPPYEGSFTHSEQDPGERLQRLREVDKESVKKGDKWATTSDEALRRRLAKQDGGYGSREDNIGNLRADSYLSAMLQVYQQCHKVLKPQGLMILVTKNFIRNQREVRLDEDTIKLCEQAGFQFVERHYRKLPSQSFWRVIYRHKYPDAPVLDKEDILVLRKGEHG